ncbi:MAG: hypothetical protein LCH84_02940 [Gemmatimonadetes bacterium]|nr:hypothetical protein [Gemmatimonadota bacterium]
MSPRTSSLLALLNLAASVVLATMLLSASRAQDPRELTIERLNIVDSTGRLALVLANGARLPGAVFEGREYPQSFVGRGKSAGMIFFNQQGDEVGGLVYEGERRDSSYRAFGHLSFDQWKQNQVVAVQYQDNGQSRSAGVRVWDRPTEHSLEEQFRLALQLRTMPPGAARDSVDRERLRVRTAVQGTPRMFLGSEDRVAKLELRDAAGRVRLRLQVDSSGAGRIAFLDSVGRVTSVYPR